MSTQADCNEVDPGLEALVTLLHFQGVAADRGQIRHRLGTNKIGARRCSGAPRISDSRREPAGPTGRGSPRRRCRRSPVLRDGRFMVLAKAAEDKVLVQSPQASRPALMTRDELLDGLGRRPDPDDPPGRIVRHRPPFRHHLVSRRDPQISPSPERGAGRFILPAAVCAGLAAVLPGGDRQGAGAPLPEHARRAGDRPGGDLDVRDRSGNSADLSVRAHHQPHRRRARRAPVPPSAGVADGLFPGAARRRFRGAGARAGEHPQFSHQLGADPRHRPALHLRVPGRDVLSIRRC